MSSQALPGISDRCSGVDCSQPAIFSDRCSERTGTAPRSFSLALRVRCLRRENREAVNSPVRAVCSPLSLCGHPVITDTPGKKLWRLNLTENYSSGY